MVGIILMTCGFVCWLLARWFEINEKEKEQERKIRELEIGKTGF